jgi:hypothetical protein
LVSVDAYFRCAFRMSTLTDRGSRKYLRAQRELSLRHREYCPSTAPYQAEQKWAAWVEPGERFHCQWAVGRLEDPALSGHLTKMGYRSRVQESISPLFEIGLRRNAVGDVSGEPRTLRSPPNHSPSGGRNAYKIAASHEVQIQMNSFRIRSSYRPASVRQQPRHSISSQTVQ